MRSIDLRRLNYFVAVAEELHFGRAAQRLHMSQPPLSHQIRILEKELGVTLFERNKRAVRLTVAGKTLLQRSAEILTSVQGAVCATQSAARGEGGSLRTGYSGSALYATQVLTAIASYRKKLPDVEIALQEGSTYSHIERLLAGTIDIGVLRGPLPKAAKALTAKPFFKERLVAALPLSHALAKTKSLSVDDLLDEPLVIYPRKRSTALYDHIVELYGKRGAVPLVAMEALQMSSIFGLVGAGVGVSIIPACVAACGSTCVAVRPLTDDDAYSELYTVVGQQISAQAQALISMLHQTPLQHES